jgi:hypothetical protein
MHTPQVDRQLRQQLLHIPARCCPHSGTASSATTTRPLGPSCRRWERSAVVGGAHTSRRTVRLVMACGSLEVRTRPPSSPRYNTPAGGAFNAVVDPREPREGLSVLPLGHRPYLKPKGVGDKSMAGKAGRDDTRFLGGDCRDPDGMVKAALAEPQCPKRNVSSRVTSTGDSPRFPRGYRTRQTVLKTLRGNRTACNGPKDTNRAPKPSSVNHGRKARSPKRHEPHGDGDPVVVSERENRLHGEGGQVR